ncbi:hypothetical protein K1719_005787 [Acacia pycnantha]|nr:hypothetical protein K1719_005787 [Acacia pycnantha]
MRLPELTFLLCLLFWACFGYNSTTMAMRTKTLLVSELMNELKKKNIESTNDSTHGGDDEYYFSSSKNNTTSGLEDKRMVPTGPNPLHNR